MTVYHESIELSAERSFRLLRWRENVSRIEVLVEPGRKVPLSGAGERWHAHSAMELTLVLTVCLLNIHRGDQGRSSSIIYGLIGQSLSLTTGLKCRETSRSVARESDGNIREPD